MNIDVRFRPYIMALSLVLISLAAHMISLWNGFVLNDHFLIPGFRDILREEWRTFWTELVTNAVIQPYAEPLLKASLALDFQSAVLSPALYHATNVLLHTTAVVSAFFLLTRLVKHFDLAMPPAGKSDNFSSTALVPFIACALFACHPLTSDTVAYISGRGAILTFIWYTVALHFFLSGFFAQSVRIGALAYLGICFSIILGVLSSCQAITIPETIIVLGLLVKPALEKGKDWVYERAFEFGIMAFLAVVIPFTFLLPQAMPVGNGLGLPLLPPVAFYATQCKELLTYYVRAFFVPVPLSIFPPFAQAQSFSDPLALGGVALLLGSIYLLFHYGKTRDPYCFFGLWIFLIGLVPQSLIVTNEYVSGQRFYLSCFGLCLFAARLFTKYAAAKVERQVSINTSAGSQMRNVVFEPVLVVPLAVVAVIFVGLSNFRDHGFATNSAILRGALRSGAIDKNLDKNGYIRAYLALMLMLDGGNSIENGLIEAKRALEINRDLPLAYLARARHAAFSDDFEGAKYYAEKAVELARKQNLSSRLIGLADGVILIAATNLEQYQDPQNLKDMAKEALLVDPTNSKLYLALGKVYLSEHKPESGSFAIKYLGHAKRLDRNDLSNEAPLAEAILATGNPSNFESAYGHALMLHKISPTTGSYILLARAALETGRLSKSAALMHELDVRLHGAYNAEAMYIMYGICKQAHDEKKAADYLMRAKKLDPNIETNTKLWLRIAPLTAIEEEREKAAEQGKTLLEKYPPKPEPASTSKPGQP